MKNAQSTFIIAIMILFSSSSFGKGMDQLTPAAPESTNPTNKKAPIDSKNIPTPMKSVRDDVKEPKITGNIVATPGFGWASLKKDSENWRAAGAGDIEIGYKLPIPPVAGATIYGTFRYAPMDVAPQTKKDGKKYEFVGVVEGYNFGAFGSKEVYPKVSAKVSAELGYLVVHLKDQLSLKKVDAPDDNGVNLNIGAGVDYTIQPGFTVGSNLHVGFGSFTTFQLLITSGFSI